MSTIGNFDEPVLGRPVLPQYHDPHGAKLDLLPNYNADRRFVTRFSCPEFTSMCPVTKQPDFARIIIDYVPGLVLVESKSFKLFLMRFRNMGLTHEAITMSIARKIEDAAKPTWVRVAAFWAPRGGIPIDVFYQTDDPPAGLYVPDPGVSPYRGR